MSGRVDRIAIGFVWVNSINLLNPNLDSRLYVIIYQSVNVVFGIILDGAMAGPRDRPRHTRGDRTHLGSGGRRGRPG